MPAKPAQDTEVQVHPVDGGTYVNIESLKDIHVTAANDETIDITNDRTITVDGKHTETIKGDTTIKITDGKLDHDVVNNTANYHVLGAVTETFDDTQTTTVKNNIIIMSTAGEILIDAKKKITLHAGDSSITLESDGTITISGKKITISGTDEVSAGVGNQNVKCDKQQVATSGAAINSSATGKHQISGAVVMIN